MSSFTNPFKFSSKAFLARILESDKAENFVSLLAGVETAGFGAFGFSSVEVLGFTISVFETVFTAS